MIKYPNSPLIKKCQCGNRPFIEYHNNFCEIYCSKIKYKMTIPTIKEHTPSLSYRTRYESNNAATLKLLTRWNEYDYYNI